MFARYSTWRRTHRAADLRALALHRGLLPTWGVLALSLAGTGLAASVAHRAGTATLVQEFETTMVRVESEIDRVMSSYQRTLLAGAGLFAASPTLSRDGWGAFAANLAIDRNFPGIQGLGFARITDVGDGSLADPDAAKTSIAYLEPRDWRNERALGYDMFAEPVRRAAMRGARDTGLPRLTRRVTLVQETGQDQQPGVLMYLPVYAGQPQSVEERRRAAIGYVYAAFRMHDLLTRTVELQLPKLLEHVHLRLLDAPPKAGGELLYESDEAAPGPDTFRGRLKGTRDLPVAGQQWHIELAAKQSFGGAAIGTSPWLVAGLGTLLSLVITAIAAALSLSRAAAVEAQRGLALEVAARTQAERQVQLANQELIHRVKNMMGVISSIATQTARFTPDPAQFISAFRDRLAALGRVHDHLRPGSRHYADLGELVREVLAPYTDLRPDRLLIAGPPVDVPSQAALMLSLVVNELATNAIKYGAWSTADGRIELAWLVSGEGKDRVLQMEWRESGGPPVAPPTHRGFGSNVLKFAVERGLKGTFLPAYEPAGFRCTWSFNLEGAN